MTQGCEAIPAPRLVKDVQVEDDNLLKLAYYSFTKLSFSISNYVSSLVSRKKGNSGSLKSSI